MGNKAIGVSETVKKTFEGAKDEMEEKMEGLHERIEHKLEKMRALKKQVQTEIRHRPMTYVALAFGAGLLLGLFSRRRP